MLHYDLVGELSADPCVGNGLAGMLQIILEHHNAFRNHDAGLKHTHILVHHETFDLGISKHSLGKGNRGGVGRNDKRDHNLYVGLLRHKCNL